MSSLAMSSEQRHLAASRDTDSHGQCIIVHGISSRQGCPILRSARRAILLPMSPLSATTHPRNPQHPQTHTSPRLLFSLSWVLLLYMLGNPFNSASPELQGSWACRGRGKVQFGVSAPSLGAALGCVLMSPEATFPGGKRWDPWLCPGVQAYEGLEPALGRVQGVVGEHGVWLLS